MTAAGTGFERGVDSLVVLATVGLRYGGGGTISGGSLETEGEEDTEGFKFSGTRELSEREEVMGGGDQLSFGCRCSLTLNFYIRVLDIKKLIKVELIPLDCGENF